MWQNSKGHLKDADAIPSNKISVSQVTLRKMSTKISTLSDHQDATNHRVDTLDDDTRPCADGCSRRGERSDCHRENNNREISRVSKFSRISNMLVSMLSGTFYHVLTAWEDNP